MDSTQTTFRSIRLSVLFVGLSVVSVAACAIGAALHYLKRAWGNPAHLTGWLLGMLFVVLAFSPRPRQIAANLRSSLNTRTGFFVFWILFFTAAHLWHFSRAPWNGNGLFDESGWDLWFLKSYVMGQPFQPAWFHSPIARETLFHYYLLAFFNLFGYNILAYEAGLFVIWAATFLFTLLLVDLLFGSYVVTGVTALVFTFLPFAFIYTFAGYRYPMATALCVMSLYFLHRGFKQGSSLGLALGGLAAGLCLASSISGKQYFFVLLLSAVLYPLFRRGPDRWNFKWKEVAIVAYTWLVAATPILCYIVFNRNAYTLYENSFIHSFWQAVRGHPEPNDLSYYFMRLWDCFFHVPGNRFFIPDVLPIPLAYYAFLLPGIALTLWKKRFEIALLGTVPVAGALIATAYENRLLLAIPFWIVLMAFTFSALVNLRLRAGLKLTLAGVAVVVLAAGLVPSIQYIEGKTRNPFAIHHYAQEQVAVSRFLRQVVGGKEPSNPPRLERDEFNRIPRIPDPPYDTLICPGEAYSIIHLFLHDYDDAKVLSFCGGSPMLVMTQQNVWSDNKMAILTYVPRNKDLKLIWESGPTTGRIVEMLQPLHDLATEESISFSFGGRVRSFYVLNIGNKNIRQFQERVSALPAAPAQEGPETVPSQVRSLPEGVTNVFKGAKGAGKGELDWPTGIAVDGSGNILVADTGNGRIEKFSSNGTFVTSIGQFEAPNGIAIDRAGNIYVAEIGSKHRVQKLGPDGTFIAEWAPGLYGPRRIAIGPDDSVYVVDSGRNRIVKFSPDGQVLASWGSEGSGDGQFRGLSSVAVDPTTNKVYVADPLNRRIQVFDSNGKFLTKWSVPEWGQPLGFEDLVVDSQRGRLCASSTHIHAVLIFDLNGNRIGTLSPKPTGKLEGPSALALANRKLYVLDMARNRVSEIDL